MPSKEPRRLRVVRRIKELIQTQSLRPGDRLPTEHALAHRFGVSRISVREGTKALEYFGVLRAAPKRGLTVGQVDFERVGACLDFHAVVASYPREQLLRTRRVIELGVLPEVMAAMKSQPPLFARLYSLTEAPGITTDPEVYLAADVAFHCELVKAANIDLLVVFNDVLRAFFARYHREVVGDDPTCMERGVAGHRTLLVALRDGKLSLATRMLRTWLDVYQD